MKVFHINYRSGNSVRESAIVVARTIEEALKKAKQVVKSNAGDEVLGISYGGEVDA